MLRSTGELEIQQAMSRVWETIQFNTTPLRPLKPALNCGSLGRPCWPARAGTLQLPISICALTQRAQNSPECWSLSCSQMLDAAADLIQRDIRDTSCPFGSPPVTYQWQHVRSSSIQSCTVYTEGPLTDAACPEGPSIYDRLPDITVICVFIMCLTSTFCQTPEPALTPGGEGTLSTGGFYSAACWNRTETRAFFTHTFMLWQLQ